MANVSMANATASLTEQIASLSAAVTLLQAQQKSMAAAAGLVGNGTTFMTVSTISAGDTSCGPGPPRELVYPGARWDRFACAWSTRPAGVLCVQPLKPASRAAPPAS